MRNVLHIHSAHPHTDDLFEITTTVPPTDLHTKGLYSHFISPLLLLLLLLLIKIPCQTFHVTTNCSNNNSNIIFFIMLNTNTVVLGIMVIKLTIALHFLNTS